MATKKIPFRTILDEQQRTYAPSGDKIEEVWAMRINDEGKEEFYIAGKTNVYEKIQAFAEEVKIENIIAKVTATGDTTIMQKVQGTYADITEFPKDLLEAQQQIKTAQGIFEELPATIKEKYENNFNIYLKDFGSETWQKNMGMIQEPEQQPVIENTKKGEAAE